jgi:hypothetical protein
MSATQTALHDTSSLHCNAPPLMKQLLIAAQCNRTPIASVEIKRVTRSTHTSRLEYYSMNRQGRLDIVWLSTRKECMVLVAHVRHRGTYSYQRVALGRHNHVPDCARFCTRCAAASIRRTQRSIGPQGAPIDDESHFLGPCAATNALRMDPRSSLPFRLAVH